MSRDEMLLIILAEECNEVAQRVSKALRFGLDEVQLGQDATNAERIMQEYCDTMAVYGLLRDEGKLPDIKPRLIDDKKSKIEKYLKYSAECGVYEDPEVTNQNPINIDREGYFRFLTVQKSVVYDTYIAHFKFFGQPCNASYPSEGIHSASKTYEVVEHCAIECHKMLRDAFTEALIDDRKLIQGFINGYLKGKEVSDE